MPGSRSSQRPCVSSIVVVRRARRRRRRTGRRERAARRRREARRAARRRLRGGGRRGTGRSRAGRARRPAARAGRRARRSSSSATPARLGALAADVEHPRRGVDADHAHAGLRDRDRDAARADPELDDRAARLARLLDVERRRPRRRCGSTGRRAARSGRRRVHAHVSLPTRAEYAVCARPPWTPQALETRGADAQSRRCRVAAELDDARVRYLGRKSELKLALREVRDRETGMVLNAVRERLERRVRRRARRRSRTAELERARSPRTGSTSRSPATRPPRGHLHLITQIRREVEDVFLGLGYEVVDGREVETVARQLRRRSTSRPGTRPARRATRSSSTTRRCCARETSPSQIRMMEERAAARSTWSRLGRVYRRDTVDATHYADVPPGRGPRRRPRDHARRPQGHAAPLHARALRRRARRSASGRTTSPSPSRRSSRTCRASSATAPAATCASTPAGSRWAARAWSTRRATSSSGYDPEEVLRLRVRARARADRARSGTACRTSGCSGRTTSAS